MSTGWIHCCKLGEVWSRKDALRHVRTFAGRDLLHSLTITINLRATGIDSQKVGPNAPTTWPTTLQDYVAKRAKNVNNFHCTGLTDCTFGNSVEDCESSPFEYMVLNAITNLGHWIFNIVEASGRAFPTTGFSSAKMLGTFTNKSPVCISFLRAYLTQGFDHIVTKASSRPFEGLINEPSQGNL